MQSRTKNAIAAVVGLSLVAAAIAAFVVQHPSPTQEEVRAVKDGGTDAATTSSNQTAAASAQAASNNSDIPPQVQAQLDIAGQQAQARIVTPLAMVIDDYKANEVDGDNKYRGKYIHFRGVAGSVEKDVSGKPLLSVTTTDPASDDHVSVRFDADGLKNVASVRPGQIIDLSCVGDGKGLATPRFTSCSFLSGDSVSAPYAALQSENSAAATDDPIYQPSFDCTKQKGAAYWLICHDADLAAADVRLDRIAHKLQNQAQTIDNLGASSNSPEQFRNSLRSMLQKRNQCTDVPCLAEWYYGMERKFGDASVKLDTFIEQAKLERSLQE
ncbi:hypothetical protein DF142_21130 [Burkholderia cenocepacia]|uniref:OB-fold protein n=1 Tax=Burkholderia cenocepacia TaxID=95486 RepID=UPI000F56C9FC|nr:hypothetical protein [Burkholderia cenocepacia]RQU38930.1 hypothetical protein DF142_21130 [Burkholderia cenocepacia]RQU63156.1 hypothetical protein DF140_22735 [Burkholderia cenocepacia]